MGKLEKRQHKYSFAEVVAYIVFALSVVATFAVSWRLFYLQYSQSGEGQFSSDLGAHISEALNGGGYSLMWMIFRIFYKISPTGLSLTFSMALITALTALAAMWCMQVVLKQMGVKKYGVLYMFAGVLALFMSSIYVPQYYSWYYKTTFGTQPWHNSTFLLMRLVGTLVVAMYLKMETNYLKKIEWKDAIAFIILLTLVNYAKPNFIIAFAPMMLIYLIADFIKGRGKGTVQMIKFGMCVIASLWVLLVQMKLVYPSDGDSGIGFTLDNIKAFFSTKLSLVSLACGLAFPLFVSLLVLIKKIRFGALGKMWIMFAVSMAQRIFFIETGPRRGHGNFGWGSRVCAYYLFIVSFATLVGMYKNKKIGKLTFALGIAIFLLHITSGLFYLKRLFDGDFYMI